MKTLLINHTEFVEQAKYGNALAVMDVFIGMIGGCLGLEMVGEEKVGVPKMGGRYLVAKKDSPPHASHNGFEHWKATSSWVLLPGFRRQEDSKMSKSWFTSLRG